MKLETRTVRVSKARRAQEKLLRAYANQRSLRKRLPMRGYDPLIPADVVFSRFAGDLNITRRMIIQARKRRRSRESAQDAEDAANVEYLSFRHMENYCAAVGWAISANLVHGYKVPGYDISDLDQYDDDFDDED